MQLRAVLTPFLVAGAMLASAQYATAESYLLPIEGGGILKVFVEGGVAKRIRQEGNVTIFEVTMDDGGCRVTEVRVMPNSFATGVARGQYDVCSEAGFSLSYRSM